jgi:hypothetical protein
MKKLTVLLTAGLFLFGMAGMAFAIPFTLDSYTVSLNTSEPGLVVYANDILTEPTTFNLNVGQSAPFTLFELGTDETWANLGEDTTPKPISVAFNFSTPSVNNDLNGTTTGVWAFITTWGNVNWNNPALFDFGTTGQFSLILNDANFGTPGHTDITGSIKYLTADTDPAPTPEPGTVLLLGIGLAGLAALKWRKRA